jgi:hypothetical protein
MWFLEEGASKGPTPLFIATAWLRSRGARFRLTRQNYCSGGASFRLRRYSFLTASDSWRLQLPLKRRRGGGRPAMLRRLLVGIGQLDNGPFVIRSSHKGDSGRQVVGGESGRDRDSGYEHQERIQMRSALRVYPGRVHPVLDQRRLVLYGFMNDGIQLIVRHDFQYTDREFLSGLKVSVVFAFVRGGLQAVCRVTNHPGEIGRAHHFL